MARVCARCRLPVGRNPADHDCPDDDDPGPEDSSDDDEDAG